MNRRIKDFTGMLVLAAGLSVGGTAAACTVGSVFSDCLDTLGLFDASDSAPDAGNPNLLIIDLDNFMAGGGGVGISAFDTLSLKITAPAGQKIASLTYNETGQANVPAAGDTAVATGSITANGIPSNLGLHIYTGPSGGVKNWALDETFDFTASVLTEMLVTISNSLFAVGPTADIEKQSASLEVTFAPIPLPASVLLFGSALMGLAVIRRDRKASTAA